jgi:hypothetical protein
VSPIKKVLICGFVEPKTLCSIALCMSILLPLGGFHPNAKILPCDWSEYK